MKFKGQIFEGANLRSKCGKARIAYAPYFSKTKPFSIYYQGTAVNTAYTLGGAIQNLNSKGVTFDGTEEWK